MKLAVFVKNIQKHICIPYYLLCIVITAVMIGFTLSYLTADSISAVMGIDIFMVCVAVFFSAGVFRSGIKIASANNISRGIASLGVILSLAVMSFFMSGLTVLSGHIFFHDFAEFEMGISWETSFVYAVYRAMPGGSYEDIFLSFAAFLMLVMLIVCFISGAFSAFGGTGRVISSVSAAAVVMTLIVRYDDNFLWTPIIYIMIACVIAATAFSVYYTDRYGV